MKGPLFSPLTITFIGLAGLSFFLLSIALTDQKVQFLTDPICRTIGANSGSNSAVGFSGFYRFLEKLNFPISRIYNNSAFTLSPNHTLILTEPEIYQTLLEQAKIKSFNRILVIFPKRRFYTFLESSKNRGWVDEVKPLDLQNLSNFLPKHFGLNTIVINSAWPDTFLINELGYSPSGSESLNLLTSKDNTLNPLLATDQGILLAELVKDNTTIWFLSDPDILNNSGIGNGKNLSLALAIILNLSNKGNFPGQPQLLFAGDCLAKNNEGSSEFSAIFKFPLIIITALIIFGCLLLVLAGGKRFGAPIKDSEIIDFGKSTLIKNSARLLERAGHRKFILNRYLDMTLRSLGKTLHAPKGLNQIELKKWLKDFCRQTKKTFQPVILFESILADDNLINNPRIEKSIRELYMWKEELESGSKTSR